MASWIYFSLCVVALIVLSPVSGTVLNINPIQITVGGTNPTTSLNGSCTPPSAATVGYSIAIGRRRSGTDMIMVQISSGINNNQPEIKDSGLRQRLTVNGIITGNNPRLEFSLRDPTCSDVDYTFFCETQFAPTTAGNTEATRNITARANPENINMIPDPDRVQYNPPVLVEFKCTGLIGSEFPDNQANFWRWDWRSVGEFTTNWVPYPYPANISYDTPRSNGCNFDGRSVLTHTVTDNDNGRQFRCSVVNADFYSDNKTVYTQTPPSTNNPGEVSDDDPASADIGMIVGIVIGVLAAIVIVVVLVYFLVFRRRSGGDDYDTGEGKPNGPEMTDNVVYSTPASKQTRGKGRENDAMDEPHEKNPRPYYANDFGDRGRSNPAMDNDSRHDRSFDDDNTDHRVRSPYGSAV